jgi:hypothetical protein
MPMADVALEEYRSRTPKGYPVVVDEPHRGAIGLLLDPSHSLHLMSDGERLWAELRSWSSRADARSSASREKYGGAPFVDRRPIDPSISDQELRNLLAELLSRYNFQPTFIHITDT